MRYPSRRQYKHAKKPYRVRNWANYERGLVQRGDLTVRQLELDVPIPDHTTLSRRARALGRIALTHAHHSVHCTCLSTHDSTRVTKLLRQNDRALASSTSDSAYDSAGVYRAIHRHVQERGRRGCRALIPTGKRAQAKPKTTTPASTVMKQRARTVRSIQTHGRRH